MKISVNSRLYQNRETGIPKYIKSLYSSLIKEHPKNEYIFFQTSKTKHIGDTKVAQTFPGFIGDFLFDNFYVSRFIEEVRPDIYHGPAHILPFNKIREVKYVLTIHDLTFLFYPEFYSRLHVLYYRHMVPNSLKKADLVIADSLNTKHDIEKYYHYPKNKIKVIYLGVENHYFSSLKNARFIKEKYFFSLITHPRRKNLTPILEIIANNKSLQEYKFVVAGSLSFDHAKEIQIIINQLNLEDRIILLGFVSEDKLKNLYHYADFFLYPSLYEGFGLPVLEAMACKCPVITSNTSSMPEISLNKTYLVNPIDKNDIEEKMLELLKLPSKKKKALVENNYRFAKKFTWTNTAKEYFKVFNSLL